MVGQASSLSIKTDGRDARPAIEVASSPGSECRLTNAAATGDAPSSPPFYKEPARDMIRGGFREIWGLVTRIL